MAVAERVQYPYYDANGVRLDLEISALSRGFAVRILLNGIPSKRQRSTSLHAALVWALAEAAHLVSLFGLGPASEHSVSDAETVIREQLVV